MRWFYLFFLKIKSLRKLDFLIFIAVISILIPDVIANENIENKPQIITLSEAYKKAILYDAKVAISRAELSSSNEEVNKNFARFLPDVRASLSKGKAKTEIKTEGVTRNYDTQNYSITLRQPLFNKSLFANYGQTIYEAKHSEMLLKKEEADLFMRVSESYLNVLYAEENIRYSDIQITSLEVLLKQAQKKFDSGFGDSTDINIAQSNLYIAQSDNTKFKSELEFRKKNFESIVGEYPSGNFLKIPEKINFSEVLTKTAFDFINIALEKNPEIQAAKLQIQTAEKEVEKNKSGHYPTLDLVASQTHSESDNPVIIGRSFDTSALNIQMNVPIFSGGYVNASVRQAESSLEKAKEQENAAIRDVKLKIEGYMNTVKNSALKIHAYEKAVRTNVIKLKAIQAGNEKGIKTTTDILEAEEKLASTKRDLVKSKIDYIQGLISLEVSAGMLTDVEIENINNFFEGNG